MVFPPSASLPRRTFARGLLLLAAAALSGCAGLGVREAPRVSVASLTPTAGQGLEARFDLALRVQNPNDAAIDYNGIALDLDLNGRPFASGVSDQRGTVPRFGESVITIPVTISALDAVRQAWGWLDAAPGETVPYRLRGRLAGGLLGGLRFNHDGELSLPAMGAPGR